MRGDGGLEAALVLASELSEIKVPVRRDATLPDGWLARSYASFPEQRIGRRFALRERISTARQPREGSPSRSMPASPSDPGNTLNPGMHPCARGCRRGVGPSPILDLGTGSGILAMAAASLLRRPVLATDIEPWSIWVAQRNVILNRLGRLVTVRLADGWRHAAARRHGPYGLVFANILARPLCQMARKLALHLLPGGTAILSGLLEGAVRAVLAAHLRCGLRLEAITRDGPWATLIMRRPAGAVGQPM